MTLKCGCGEELKAMTNVISCTTAVSAVEFIQGPTCEKGGERKTGAAMEQRLSERREAVRSRCFTTADQIIELHLQYYHCRLTFLWVCEITHEHLLPCNTMRHTRAIQRIETLRIKRQLFYVIWILEESPHESVSGWGSKNFCGLFKKLVTPI